MKLLIAKILYQCKTIIHGICILILITILTNSSNNQVSGLIYTSTKDFTWILVYASFVAFFAAYGIGIVPTSLFII